MPDAVAHLFKLIEDDHIVPGVAQLPGFIKDLFYVALAAGSGNDLPGDLAEPVKAFPAHFRRQDGDAVAGKEFAVKGAAPAVVAGGGPYGLIIGGVELAGDQPGHQTAIGSAHLVAPRGEPLADEADDPGLDAGKAGGQFDIVDATEAAAFHGGLVMPADAEQVQGIHIPKTHVFQGLFYLLGDLGGVFHLLIGGQDDMVLSGYFDIPGQCVCMDGKIDHDKTSLILKIWFSGPSGGYFSFPVPAAWRPDPSPWPGRSWRQ